jgi:hypothetical protein
MPLSLQKNYLKEQRKKTRQKIATGNLNAQTLITSFPVAIFAFIRFENTRNAF